MVYPFISYNSNIICRLDRFISLSLSDTILKNALDDRHYYNNVDCV